MAWSTTGVSDVIDDSSSWQTLTREWGSVYLMRTRTRTTEIRGLTRNAALGWSTHEVSYITQTAGTAYFEHFGRTIQKRKANAADGWTVTIVEKWAAMYQNGTRIYGAAEHYFTDTNPEPLES